MLTGKHNLFPGKNLKVEKNDLKMTKNRFFGFETLTTFRHSYFSTITFEINYNKVYNARNYKKSRVY